MKACLGKLRYDVGYGVSDSRDRAQAVLPNQAIKRLSLNREVLGGTDIGLSAIRIATGDAPSIFHEQLSYFWSAQFSHGLLQNVLRARALSHTTHSWH